ncbi:MAG: hypothetical protein M0Q23_00635 [Syntrophales bacterium]|jgi:recombination associated protein RdgC|nr:hypothetical protein [Syntrophales bacterium]MCK9527154.1 hypothetical protein [Syntrophales bacterium]MDX9921721.1 hypothetical protein [Syntrophales bacterium]
MISSTPEENSPRNTDHRDLAFLGREFLTWLWFKSEERNGAIALPNSGDVHILFLRRIVLESGRGEYSETVVCSGLHADLSEGREALRTGKKVKEARIRMGIGNDEWEFTFKADGFHFQSMKMPSGFESVDDEVEQESNILDRVGSMDLVVTTMERLFLSFVELRRSDAWLSLEVPRIKKWIAR